MLDPVGTPARPDRVGSVGRPRRATAGCGSSSSAAAQVDELIYEEIARRREAPDLEQREDVFSMLLLARDEDGAR